MVLCSVWAGCVLRHLHVQIIVLFPAQVRCKLILGFYGREGALLCMLGCPRAPLYFMCIACLRLLTIPMMPHCMSCSRLCKIGLGVFFAPYIPIPECPFEPPCNFAFSLAGFGLRHLLHWFHLCGHQFLVSPRVYLCPGSTVLRGRATTLSLPL